MLVRLFFLSLVHVSLCGFDSSKDELTQLYDYYRTTPSDIYEHVSFLKDLAGQCSSIAEIGTGNVPATFGLLMGLVENNAKNRFFTEVQSRNPPLEKLYLTKRLAAENGIAYKYVQTADVNFELENPVELLFIDGVHTYCHLTHQLRTLSPKVIKYIVMHDTSPPWGYANDTTYCGDYSEFPKDIDRKKKGLSVAVEDFLAENPGWVIHERRMNNHGLFVLKKKDKIAMKDNPQIDVFIHACTLPGWQAILKRQLQRMKDSGLYDAAASINLGVLGRGDLTDIKELFPKINLLFQDPDCSKYERLTLLALQKKCADRPDGSHVLYFHTKGVSRASQTVSDWTKFLEYFVIDRWKDCVESLKTNDVAGVNWQLGPKPHFSGNFWWATSAYVATLPHWIGLKYLDPEMWLCQNFPNFKCFHLSNVDHYYTPYPESIYTR